MASLGPLEAFWGPLGGLLGPLGGFLGASWRPLGASWGSPGGSWRPFEGFGGRLEVKHDFGGLAFFGRAVMELSWGRDRKVQRFWLLRAISIAYLQ